LSRPPPGSATTTRRSWRPTVSTLCGWGVIWAGVEPEPGVFDTAYIDSIQQTVQTLADHGIYTILDFHQDEYSSAYGGEGAPAWAAQSVD